MTVPLSRPGLAVQADGVSFRYPGGQVALDGFSLDVAAGDNVALVGPNGSGKTTFALHLNGLVPIQSGAIKIGQVPVVAERLGEVRRLVGSVFQNPDDQLFMGTVTDDVEFGPANLGLGPDERTRRVTDALAAVGASALADRTSHHLSVGEKRRVAIASVLSMEPAVLVLDEPTAGLDPVGRRELATVLRALPQTMLLITHDLDFAAAVCERVAIVNNGNVAAVGEPDDVFGNTDLLAANDLI